MTPDEVATLHQIGLDVVQQFVAIVNETILLTIYGVLVLKATLLLLRKSYRHSKVSKFTVATILVMFTITLILWSIDMANFILEAKLTLLVNPDGDIGDKLNQAYDFILPLVAIQDALYAYLSVLGDAIIIFRIYVLWGTSRHRWVLIAPCALLVGSLIATLMLTYCVGHLGSNIVLGSFTSPAFCVNAQMATYSMAAATTAIATILIGVMTWNYRKSISPILSNLSGSSYGGGRRRSRAERILLLLVESGLLYFLFFIIQVIGAIPQVAQWLSAHSGLSFAETMFAWASSVLVGIYPTAIIVLSHSKYAVIDGAASATSTLRTPVRVHLRTTDTGGYSDTVRWHPDDVELPAARGHSLSRKEEPGSLISV